MKVIIHFCVGGNKLHTGKDFMNINDVKRGQEMCIKILLKTQLQVFECVYYFEFLILFIYIVFIFK
jgi:hypothetical protein